MALFSKKDKDTNTDEVKNPIEEIQSNKDFNADTFVPKSESAHRPNPNNTMTNLSSQSSLEGIIKVEGDITINGKVKGSITAKGKAIVGQSGIIEGDILAQNAEISGKVTGKVEIAQLLALKGEAKINGDIYTDKLIIEKDASFNGKCIMGKNTASSVSNQVNKEKPKVNTLNS